MRIFLAPMEGVVDHHLRQLYAGIGGIDLCVSEFIRVTDTRLPEKVFKRYCPELLAPHAIPVRVQLLGSRPRALAYNAAKAAHMGATAVDLNFGCPAKTVNKHRGGACLLDEPRLLHDIVRAVREAVPSEVPVTAKIRLGFEQRRGYLQTATAIAAAGASELVVHARSKADAYRPPAYWRCIGTIRHALAIPVVANGEIWSVEDYRRCRELSGCEDVMLGRGLLARPDLARAIKAQCEAKPYSPLSWAGVLTLLYEFHQQTRAYYPRKYCGNRLKQWLMYLQRQYPEAQGFFEYVKRTRDPETIEEAFDHWQRAARAGEALSA